MSMRAYVTFGAVLALAVILGGLVGWYLFLHSRTKAIEEVDAARGFGMAAPMAFGGNPLAGSSVGGGGNAAYPPSPVSASRGTDIRSPLSSAGAFGDGAAGAPTAPREGTTTAASSPKRLIHPARMPVAGFGFISRSGATRLYYAERATGYVFSVNLGGGEVSRVTNTLRPKIYEALFDESGVIERGIADDGSVETFVGTLGVATPTSTAIALGGSPLEKNISAISIVGAAQPGIFYLRAKDGGTEGIIARRDGAKGKTAFASPLTDWRPYALADGRLIVAQKAATNVSGFAYEVAKNGTLSPVAAEMPGLIILPHTWVSALIWSSSDAGGTALFARGSAAAEPRRLPIATVAEKCAWVPPPADASSRKPGALVAYCAVPRTPPSPHFLEEWYQGVLHTDDAWWRVDAASGSVEPLKTSGGWDARDPAIDPSGRFLAFIDGNDDSLWVLILAQ